VKESRHTGLALSAQFYKITVKHRVSVVNRLPTSKLFSVRHDWLPGFGEMRDIVDLLEAWEAKGERSAAVA
jgi:hypothetical protein